ncbi:MAG: hypothetical protein O9335_02420 [Inhella sp.]|uniref:hypothetical protein n=1 Tax=Inhella sp. TaxID=1921806 RepID=UPI0022C20C03|nr:hypothetical protein [Inhella sp.]MCZ8233989.1 hypothetical protein [Inhella sp.]
MTLILAFFGHSAWTKHVEARRDIKLREIQDETQRATLLALQTNSQQSTQQMKIMADALTSYGRLRDVEALAHDAHNDILRMARSADSAKVGGIEISGGAAVSLVENARRKSEEVRLDGIYRIARVDWSGPTGTRLRILNLSSGEGLDADLQDNLSGDYKKVIQAAEWERKPVALSINARRIGGQVRAAVVVKAEDAPIQADPAGSASA